MPSEDNHPLYRALADELVARYKGQRLSQADLVEKTGINATTMQRIMAGKTKVYLVQLNALASALDTSMEDIISGANRRMSDEP